MKHGEKYAGQTPRVFVQYLLNKTRHAGVLR